MFVRDWFDRLRSRGWNSWPDRAYARKRYQHRLATVKQQLQDCLDAAPAGPIKILSICAGDGRDVVGAVDQHPRRNDVAAWLVELSADSVALGKRHAVAAGLEESLHFINGDATDLSTYKNVPACDVILLCGVWGHVPQTDTAALVQGLAAFCKPGATVLWSCGTSGGTAKLDEYDALFTKPTWDKVRQSFAADKCNAVVLHRYTGPSLPRLNSGRFFSFRRCSGV
jgi:SAM-dependent methyltransferase